MTDLSDFGGGVDHNPGPEDKVRIKLSNWIKQDDVTVYWDKNHSYGFNTFSLGQKTRPDLLIEAPSNTYAVEVKVGDQASKIHDALPHLVNYWEGSLKAERITM